jgi:prepilin-type N-terminal cleavage/methylation domain-containing protein
MRLAQRKILKRKTSSGFTIVELLIVIIVIGILAAIIIVAYNGVTKSAQTAAITSEIKQWHKLFEAYKATNGSYPAPSATPATGGGPGSTVLGGYCLGTGFPQTGGVGNCFVVTPGTVYTVAESTGTSLLTQLSTVGTPPKNSTKYVYNTVTGPVLIYYSVTDVRLYAIYPSGTTCPTGMIAGYGDANRQDCYIKLDYS